MTAESLSVREASRYLGISPRTVKRLCENGRLPHFTTPGGHYRFRRSDLEALVSGDNRSGTSNGSGSHGVLENRRERVQELVLEAQELRARRDLRVLQTEDQAAESRRQNEAREAMLAEQRKLELLRLEAARQTQTRREKARQAREEHRRRQWELGWQEYALQIVPRDALHSVELDVHLAVAEALAKLAPDHPAELTRRIVHAAVERGQQPWRRRKEIDSAIASAPDRLPWAARGCPSIGEPSEWYIRAQRAAADAIAQLSGDAPVAKIRAVAIEASDQICAEYQSAKAAADHRVACQRLVDSVFLLHASSAEERAARQAVKESLDKLPAGTSSAELARNREAALAPFQAAIAERQARVQAAALVTAQIAAYLRHVDWYLGELAANDQSDVLELGDFSARYRRAQELKERLRPILTEKLKLGPHTEAEAHRFIQEFIDGELGLDE